MGIIASADMEYRIGARYKVLIRRDMDEPFHDLSIFVVRAATKEEFDAYNKAEGMRYQRPVPGFRYWYYEILMD